MIARYNGVMFNYPSHVKDLITMLELNLKEGLVGRDVHAEKHGELYLRIYYPNCIEEQLG